MLVSPVLPEQTHLTDEPSDLTQLLFVALGSSESELDNLDETAEASPLHGELFCVAVGGALDQVLERGQRGGDEGTALSLLYETVWGHLLPCAGVADATILWLEVGRVWPPVGFYSSHCEGSAR